MYLTLGKHDRLVGDTVLNAEPAKDMPNHADMHAYQTPRFHTQ